MRIVSLMMLALAGLQEDQKQEGVAAIRDEAVKAIRATLKSGNFEFSGEAQIGMDDPAVNEGDTLGKFSGSASSPLQVALKATAGKKKYEVFHKDGKTIERLTWRGTPLNTGSAADEILSLLDLEKLAGSVEKVKVAKASKDQKVGPSECRVLELTMPQTTIRAYFENEGDGEEEMAVETVDLKIWISKSDGLILRMEASVQRASPESDDDGSTVTMKSSYTVTLSKHGAAKVEIPAEILKQLSED